MPIDILEMTSPPALNRQTLPDLKEASIRAADGGIKSRTVWIVTFSMSDELERLAGVVNEPKNKHARRELARYLPQGASPKIPIVKLNFDTAGKLLASLKKMFLRWNDGPSNLMILAVTDNLFATLFNMAPDPAFAPAPEPTYSGRYGAVLSLMKSIPDPPELQKAFIGNSEDARAVRQLILNAAKGKETVLITGETGTGKEIVAQQIHALSGLSGKPVSVNCGAFPKELLDSELFGHVKGAYTGATLGSAGLWYAAQDGTLFLDEIGELSLNQQAKLLRALQEKKIRKVGGTADIQVNARIICATNRDLYEMVRTGQFRKDLYYRLRCFLITTSPLRDHPEDIPLLAGTFWRDTTGNNEAILPEEVIKELCVYPWPGNVRELRMILSHLFGLYRNVPNLDARHLHAVFEMQGLHLHSEACAAQPSSETRPGGFAAFRRLRRVFEAVRALEHHLTPFLNEERIEDDHFEEISTVVLNLLNELDLHLVSPRQFSPGTFDNLSLLRSRLAYFFSPAAQAADRPDQEAFPSGMRTLLTDTNSAILAEMDHLLPVIL